MLCKDIIRVLEEKYPASCALAWDNVGLLAGRDDREVRKIYVALDATDEAVEAAVKTGADMLVTHHPLIFGGIRCVNNRDFTGKRLLKLLEGGISYYAMHTNYDVRRMAGLAWERLGMCEAEVLEVTARDEAGREEGPGRIGNLDRAVPLKEYCEAVKNAFGLENVKVYGDLSKKIKRVAVCPGSGKSVIKTALEKDADVLVTGDVGHHEGIDSTAQGMAVIDAGHYGIEHIFVADMAEDLRGTFPGIEVEEEPVCHPFVVV